MAEASNWVKRAVLLMVAVGGASLAHVSQQRADDLRFSDDSAESWLKPHGPSLRTASMGQPGIVADVLWVRAVLNLALVLEKPDQARREWVGATLDAIAVLDPTWRTLYFYGGIFLRLVGDYHGSDRVFAEGWRQIPDDPYFPFSIGMNAYLYHQDTERAIDYVGRAAALPKAPPWYRAAVAGMIDEHGQRRTAIRYVEDQLAQPQRDVVRKELEKKRNGLIHDEIVSLIAERRQSLLAAGRPDIRSVDDLGELPPDPYGAGWILAPDGVVRSAHRELEVAKKAINDERETVRARN